MDARPLRALWGRTRPRGHHAGGGAPSDLRPLHAALELRVPDLPVLPQRGSNPHHLVCDTGRAISRVRMRCLPALLESVRRPACDTPGDADGGFSGDAAAGRGSHAAGLFLAPVLLDADPQFVAGAGVGDTPPIRSWAFEENQLTKWRVSQNRPAFDFAPSTTTATCGPPCGRRRSVARQ